jgi:L-threonylcarbamoyladenylate synthase
MDEATIKNLAEELNQSGVAVIPTDTVYGIVARAIDEVAVNKLVTIRGRETGKPFIILISSLDDLKAFKLNLIKEELDILNQLWPGPFSIGFSTKPGFEYLKNETNQLTFRLPDNPSLVSLIRLTGPLIAPSANRPGEPVAKDIEIARAYFGDQITHYIDGGELLGEPSTVITLSGVDITIKRQGKGAVPETLLNPQIDYIDFQKVKLKIGTVVAAERVEKSDKLLKLQIDIGEAVPRQIIAGIGLGYEPDQLIGLQVAIVANLKPRKLMGLESQGMIMAGSDEKGPVVLNPNKPVSNGNGIH